METKEAIEFCDEIDDLINAVEDLSDNSRSEIYRDLISLKKLLKRGEKFEAMWREVEKEKCLMIDFDNEGYFKSYHCLGDIKQKYFPQGGRQ